MSYRLYVAVDPDGAITKSMLNASLDGPPAGFVELPGGPWWTEIASSGGERWYYEDGPRRRAPVRIVVDRSSAKAGEEIVVRLESRETRPVLVNVGGDVLRMTPGEDRVRVRWATAGQVPIAVVDPRCERAERVLEFTEE